MLEICNNACIHGLKMTCVSKVHLTLRCVLVWVGFPLCTQVTRRSSLHINFLARWNKVVHITLLY